MGEKFGPGSQWDVGVAVDGGDAAGAALASAAGFAVAAGVAEPGLAGFWAAGSVQALAAGVVGAVVGWAAPDV